MPHFAANIPLLCTEAPFPGRFAPASDWHQPGTGEVDLAYVFDWIDTMGYGDWIGCKYRPVETTAEGLGWFAPYRA
ncbi:hypothetical protein [Roseomonas indoligenes]|uniref:Hydroxypyruvate isomerase n=1 Tax=Roseomonas indoligenes TaxID=2820811 RepID=A0A940MY72_9PROT|nr:hypothetical protein [Pararoseomonas indoligenes]MBP0493014.1 hypothetical protein [Pararoseomonas indoligenes]